MQDQKLTVVLDLDECLMHSYNVVIVHHVKGYIQQALNSKAPKKNVFKRFGVHLRQRDESQEKEVQVRFVKRPGLDTFLDQVAELDVNVVFWTASEKLYADTILDYILPKKLKSCKRLYRADCTKFEKPDGKIAYFKDLRTVFSDEQLEKLVLVDDTKKNFEATPNNGLCVAKWLGDLKVEAVDYLESVFQGLKRLADTSKVCEEIKAVQNDLNVVASEGLNLFEMEKQRSKMKRKGKFAPLGSLASFVSGYSSGSASHTNALAKTTVAAAH